MKNMPAMQETQVLSLSWEDPLEKEMATHSGILAWRVPLTEEPGGPQSMGSQRVGHDSACTPARAQRHFWFSSLEGALGISVDAKVEPRCG